MENTCIICEKEFKQLQNRKRKRCNACNTKIRRHRNKLKAVELLGGKCCRCGFDGNPAALEFHHRDPKEKDFNISMCANKSWEVLKEEVLKCDLLCSNCHRIEHSDRFSDEFYEHVKKYKGK